MEHYIKYAVYECPSSPKEKGKYIGSTPVLAQAIQACKKAQEQNRVYFIKGVKEDGLEIIML